MTDGAGYGAGMRVAVTGASGFLGSYVVEALRAGGHAPVGVIRTPGLAAEVRARGAEEVRLADLLDGDALRAAFLGCDAAVLVAALAVRHDPPWDEWRRANVEGVERAVLAAADAGVRRLVLVSTVAVHRVLAPGGVVRLDHPRLDEVHVPWSVHFVGTQRNYARSKALGERRARALAAERGLGLTVLRPGPVYGGRDPKTTSRYRALLDRSVVALPTARIPHVHAADVAACCVAALDNPASVGRDYFVTGPPVSLVELVATLRDLAGRGPWIVPLPVPFALRYDDGPAIRDLSFRPRDLRAGLAEVLAEHPRGGIPAAPGV